MHQLLSGLEMREFSNELRVMHDEEYPTKGDAAAEKFKKLESQNIRF